MISTQRIIIIFFIMSMLFGAMFGTNGILTNTNSQLTKNNFDTNYTDKKNRRHRKIHKIFAKPKSRTRRT